MVRRVKVKLNECPVKALFLQWLTEWKEEAKKKESKLAFTFGRAFVSMRKYPLGFKTGYEASIVQCCGPKICQMLDDRLNEYKREFGDPSTPDNPSTSADVREATSSSDASAKMSVDKVYSSRTKPDCGKSKQPVSADDPAMLASWNSGRVPESSTSYRRISQGGSQGSVKPYIPTYRSAAYALMVALYRYQSNSNASSAAVGKAELISLAQPHADASLTVPEAGKEYYTGWSSMGTLERKGLVQRQSHPPQFSLTDAGMDLAHNLVHTEHQASDHNLDLAPSTSGTVGGSAGRKRKKAASVRDKSAKVSISSIEKRNDSKKTTSGMSPSRADPDLLDDDFLKFDSPPKVRHFSAGPSCSSSLVRNRSVNAEQARRDLAGTLGNRSCEESRLGFIYLDPDLKEVPWKEQAKVEIDPDLSDNVGYLVKLLWKDLARISPCDYKLASDDFGQGDVEFVHVYLAEKLADEHAPGIKSSDDCDGTLDACSSSGSVDHPERNGFTALKPPSSMPGNAISCSNVNSAESYADSVPLVPVTDQRPNGDIHGNLTNEGTTTVSSDLVPKTDHPDEAEIAFQLPPLWSAIKHPEPLSCCGIKSSQDSIQRSYSSEKVPAPSSEADLIPDGTGDFSLGPGQFDITLCVDHGEAAGDHPAKKQMISVLRKNNVPFVMRRLKVGDFAWIASRKRHQSAQGLPFVAAELGNHGHASAEEEELVLDFIVERKRLDDLSSSIIDGRFHEQKHRLKNCGLRRPIYLVEDFGSVANQTISQEGLLKAINNTQFQDGFQIIRTGNVDESVAFLTLLTKQLLVGCSGKKLVRRRSNGNGSGSTCLPALNISDSTMELMSFDVFQMCGLKQGPQTVRELFTRQLMQFKGVSVDKALEITRVYPTVRALMAAYTSCADGDDKAKEGLISKLKPQNMNQCIGQAIGKPLAAFYDYNTGPFRQ